MSESSVEPVDTAAAWVLALTEPDGGSWEDACSVFGDFDCESFEGDDFDGDDFDCDGVGDFMTIVAEKKTAAEFAFLRSILVHGRKGSISGELTLSLIYRH